MAATSASTDGPWPGDACSLVDAFRRGDRSPSEELAAVYAAIDASDLNAFSHLHREQAEEAARRADVSKPFGGVPIGVKELDQVAGWPDTHACIVFRDQIAHHTSTNPARARDEGGAILVGQTTASEFGGVNLTRTVLNGVTHNPWRRGRTPGGSSGGTAAAVAGGLVTLGTGGDGGGSIRIPAGFTGLVGLKATYGRIPLTPNAVLGAMTVTHGCLSRSVRDTARWFDVCNGRDPREPLTLPRVEGWEDGLGTHLDELRGKRVAVVPDWGGAVVSPVMWEQLEAVADQLIDDCGMVRVDGVDTHLPRMGAAWSVANSVGLIDRLGPHWPACADVLTPEIRMAMEHGPSRYGAEARIKLERRRAELDEAMARIFDVASGGVDFVMTASNPDVAFDAEGPLPSVFGGIEAGAKINGRLTFPANLHGNPAISVPAGSIDALPIGLQIVGSHFGEELLLDLALTVERERPWPLTVHDARAAETVTS
jgi:aspartyl-tRNA(Asn)/glutamyl-tRNA(Gln) amidotransferase subunit A